MTSHPDIVDDIHAIIQPAVAKIDLHVSSVRESQVNICSFLMITFIRLLYSKYLNMFIF